MIFTEASWKFQGAFFMSWNHAEKNAGIRKNFSKKSHHSKYRAEQAGQFGSFFPAPSQVRKRHRQRPCIALLDIFQTAFEACIKFKSCGDLFISLDICRWRAVPAWSFHFRIFCYSCRSGGHLLCRMHAVARAWFGTYESPSRRYYLIMKPPPSPLETIFYHIASPNNEMGGMNEKII